MITDKFQEQVFFTTVRITITSETETGSSIGTGFLMRTQLIEGTDVILLVSNKHVLQNTNGTIIINMNKKKATADTPDLGNIHSLSGKGFGDNYFEHPDPNVDLACVNLSMIANLNLYYKTIPFSMLSDFTEENLLPGGDVWFVGYPENRFDTRNNLPLLRKGFVASLPRVDFNDERQFVIDAQVFQGSSGSPVFTPIGQKFKLIGVVTATMIKHGQLEMVPSLQNNVGVQQILGLGIVIKSVCVKELIQNTVKEINRRRELEQ